MEPGGALSHKITETPALKVFPVKCYQDFPLLRTNKRAVCATKCTPAVWYTVFWCLLTTSHVWPLTGAKIYKKSFLPRLISLAMEIEKVERAGNTRKVFSFIFLPSVSLTLSFFHLLIPFSPSISFSVFLFLPPDLSSFLTSYFLPVIISPFTLHKKTTSYLELLSPT